MFSVWPCRRLTANRKPQTANPLTMNLTYYYDVCSMWCALGDEVLLAINKRYGSRVPIERKIALINDGNPMAAGLEQEKWYYDRCELVTGRRFNHYWIETDGQTTWAPNAVIQAAEHLGHGDAVREVLKTEGLIEGKPILRKDTAIELAAKVTGISPSELARAVEDEKTTNALTTGIAEFNLLPGNQRPTFLIRSAIEDTALLSGIYRAEPVFAAIDAMISDEEAYERFRASHTPIPE
jgi:predicted DsbA family dithiol-disulfide isomerase